jgi:hypothetical protein
VELLTGVELMAAERLVGDIEAHIADDDSILAVDCNFDFVHLEERMALKGKHRYRKGEERVYLQIFIYR